MLQIIKSPFQNKLFWFLLALILSILTRNFAEDLTTTTTTTTTTETNHNDLLLPFGGNFSFALICLGNPYLLQGHYPRWIRMALS